MKLRNITKEELEVILRDHALWLLDSSKGKRANLRYANLRYANLRYADLRYADLRYANLRYANLRYADLQYANLRYANLRYADLQYADLRYANLRYADLRYADLQYADLRYADLRYADLRYASSPIKKLKSINGLLWDILIKDDLVIVGCQEHTYLKWCNFTNEEIEKMHKDAPDFYPILMTILAYEYKDTEWAIVKEGLI